MSDSISTLNTATAFGVFTVKPLSAFKGFEAETGQYLVRKIEKGTGLESKGVVIPAATPEQFITALDNDTILQAAAAWYQETVAEVVKAKIAAGASSVVESDYALSEVVAHLQAQEIKEGRVSKEKIAAWFDATVSSVLSRAFHEKLGASLTNDKMVQILTMYRAAFQMLAKRELVLDVQAKTNLEKAVSLLPESTMKEYCVKKLESAADKNAVLEAL